MPTWLRLWGMKKMASRRRAAHLQDECAQAKVKNMPCVLRRHRYVDIFPYINDSCMLFSPLTNKPQCLTYLRRREEEEGGGDREGEEKKKAKKRRRKKELGRALYSL